jgi:hypothetical protein
MEYNNMQELNVCEIEEVNGGLWVTLTVIAAGALLGYLAD